MTAALIVLGAILLSAVSTYYSLRVARKAGLKKEFQQRILPTTFALKFIFYNLLILAVVKY